MIDDKLKDIWSHNYPPKTYIKFIKQAFADEGYVHLDEAPLQLPDPRIDPHYMTGQEFYERFDKGLHITGLGKQAEQLMRSQILEAAKKAAGL